MSLLVLLSLLYVLFHTKHVGCDFFLQSDFMAEHKGDARGWVWPLLSHCLIHGVFTLMIVCALNPSFWYLAALDVVVHFGIDRFKEVATRNKMMKPHRLLGLDQWAHHMTHGVIILILVSNAA